MVLWATAMGLRFQIFLCSLGCVPVLGVAQAGSLNDVVNVLAMVARIAGSSFWKLDAHDEAVWTDFGNIIQAL